MLGAFTYCAAAAQVCCDSPSVADTTGIPYSFCAGFQHILDELCACGLVAPDTEVDPGESSLQSWLRNGILIIPALWTCWFGLESTDLDQQHDGYGWEEFTTTLIRAVLQVSSSVQCVLLWGRVAQNVRVFFFGGRILTIHAPGMSTGDTHNDSRVTGKFTPHVAPGCMHAFYK